MNQRRCPYSRQNRIIRVAILLEFLRFQACSRRQCLEVCVCLSINLLIDSNYYPPQGRRGDAFLNFNLAA